MTRSLYQVPYFELTCAPKHALPHHVFRGASVKIGVSKSKRINVAGQGQPKHLNIQPHGQYHALKTQRIGYFCGEGGGSCVKKKEKKKKKKKTIDSIRSKDYDLCTLISFISSSVRRY